MTVLDNFETLTLQELKLSSKAQIRATKGGLSYTSTPLVIEAKNVTIEANSQLKLSIYECKWTI